MYIMSRVLVTLHLTKHPERVAPATDRLAQIEITERIVEAVIRELAADYDCLSAASAWLACEVGPEAGPAVANHYLVEQLLLQVFLPRKT